MRLLRIRLCNYRGVSEAEVQFRREGITVVTGPNEVGKSSLAEALRILFDHLDSANSREVRAIRPVHRDEGPQIDLEAESGPYAFKYSKRFHRKPQTTLTVTRPRAENLTGREAHERAMAILDETIDVKLWRSLLVTQGGGVDQADLGDRTALTAALDHAAGGAMVDPGGEDLFERVRLEAARYFTEKGMERKDILDVRAELAAAETEAGNCRRELADLDRDIAESARLAGRIRDLERRLAGLREEAAEHERRVAAVEAASHLVEKARLRHESAEKSAEAAARDFSDRAALAAAAEETGAAVARAMDACGERGPEIAAVERTLGECKAAFDAAERRRKEAQALADLRQGDLDHARGLLDLATLRERLERVRRARTEAADARAVLDGNLVDDRRLRAVVEAEKEVSGARARLGAGAPTLRVTAHGAVELESGGERRTLETGSRLEFPVPDRVRIAVPGVVEIEVSPGTSLASLHRALEGALAVQAEALHYAGAAGVEEALRAHRERKEAERTIDRLGEVEVADLRDLTLERLEAKVAGLSKHVPAYPGTRPAGAPSMPADFEEAKDLQAVARRLLEEAVPLAERSREAFDRARDRQDGLRREMGDLEADRKSTEDAHRRASTALDEARASTPDAALEGAQATAREASAAAARDLTAERESLEAMQPEKARTLAAANAASLKGAEKQVAEAREEAARVRRRLDSQGEAGLYEKLEAATRRGEAARTLLDGLLRAAGGARLLFETMGRRRDAVRAAYMTPLQKRIESLGRVLFDDTFRVEVGEDLRVKAVTRRDISIPFQDLSTGTREQVSLIVRVACAMLMSDEGGPLLLDDVIGFSDPERLRAMGAVLREGGKKCQIILLTSVPDRYAHVGDAYVVVLEGGPACS